MLNEGKKHVRPASFWPRQQTNKNQKIVMVILVSGTVAENQLVTCGLCSPFDNIKIKEGEEVAHLPGQD